MRSRALKSGALVLTMLSSFTSRGRAEPPPSDSKRTTEPEVVVVTGTRTPERSQRAVVRTDVVTRAEAERRGATNVAEALTSQPGVQVNPGAYGYLGGVSAIQIQGFDRDRVLILEDGERVIGDVGGAIDLSTIPLNDVSRIEIVSGPTSSLYGSSALGGVVNILTSPPQAEGASGYARAEGRSVPGYLLQGGAAYRSGSTWAGGDVNLSQADGVARTPGLPDLAIPELKRRMLGVRAGTSLGRGVDVSTRVRWFHDRSDGLESQSLPGLGLYLVDLPEVTDRVTAHVIGRYDLGHGSGVRITLGRQWYDGTSETKFRDSPVDEIRKRSYTMQSFEAVSTLADGPRTWVLGTRFEAEHFDQTLTKITSETGGLASNTQQEVTPIALANGAVYAQVAYKIGNAFTVLPGVRYEVHSRYGQALAPRLALAYRPSSEVQLRASAGRGYRAPSAKELGFVFDHSIYGYRVDGNPDLIPEKSWGANADASWTPGEHFSMRVGGFSNWVEDLIDIDLSAGVTNGSVTTYKYRNFGRARTAGFQAGTAFRAGDRLRAEVTYDYLWTRDEMLGQPLGSRPPHTVTGSVQAKLFAGFEVYGRWRFTSDAFVTDAPRSPSFQTVDVRIARTLWPRSQAYVGGLNLLDERQDPTRVGDIRPALGRVFYAGLRANFPWEDGE